MFKENYLNMVVGYLHVPVVLCLAIPLVMGTGCTRLDEAIICNNLKYEVGSKARSYVEAEKYCASKGGHLGKITGDMLTDGKHTPLSRFLAHHRATQGIWIGLTDRETEGEWTWYDGTPASSLRWREINFFVRMIEKWDWDCGYIYYTGWPPHWLWDMLNCPRELSFLCQMDYIPVAKEESKKPNNPRTKPIVTTKFLVAKKTGNYARIAGVPILDQRVSFPTMCSRLCLKMASCKWFNYKESTRECRGFSVGCMQGCEHDPLWEIWQIVAN